jgi:hypothetical protein
MCEAPRFASAPNYRFETPENPVEISHRAQIAETSQTDMGIVPANETFEIRAFHPESLRTTPKRPPRCAAWLYLSLLRITPTPRGAFRVMLRNFGTPHQCSQPLNHLSNIGFSKFPRFASSALRNELNIVVSQLPVCPR